MTRKPQALLTEQIQTAFGQTAIKSNILPTPALPGSEGALLFPGSPCCLIMWWLIRSYFYAVSVQAKSSAGCGGRKTSKKATARAKSDGCFSD